VHGNATATAGNIVAHESLFRLGIVSEPLAGALWLFVPKVFTGGQVFMQGEVATMLWLAIMGAKKRRLATAES